MNAQNTNTAIDSEVFAEIALAEKSIVSLKDANKENSAVANVRKIEAYSVLIASLAGQKLVKGNLPRAVSKQLWSGLTQDAGVKEATAKRYIDNSVGALRELNIPSQATPTLVKDILLSENIDSENKLAKLVSGDADKDRMKELAETLIGKFTTRKDENGNRVEGVFKASKFEQEDWDRFEDYVREFKAARAAAADAAAVAKAKEQAANDEANEVFAKL